MGKTDKTITANDDPANAQQLNKDSKLNDNLKAVTYYYNSALLAGCQTNNNPHFENLSITDKQALYAANTISLDNREDINILKHNVQKLRRLHPYLKNCRKNISSSDLQAAFNNLPISDYQREEDRHLYAKNSAIIYKLNSARINSNSNSLQKHMENTLLWTTFACPRDVGKYILDEYLEIKVQECINAVVALNYVCTTLGKWHELSERIINCLKNCESQNLLDRFKNVVINTPANNMKSIYIEDIKKLKGMHKSLQGIENGWNNFFITVRNEAESLHRIIEPGDTQKAKIRKINKITPAKDLPDTFNLLIKRVKEEYITPSPSS